MKGLLLPRTAQEEGPRSSAEQDTGPVMDHIVLHLFKSKTSNTSAFCLGLNNEVICTDCFDQSPNSDSRDKHYLLLVDNIHSEVLNHRF